MTTIPDPPRPPGRPANKARRIEQALRQALREGRWPTASVLPGEHALCAEYQVSRMCLRAAMAPLEAEGLIERQHGRGTFVRTRPSSSGIVGRICVMLPELISDEERSYHEQLDRGMRTALQGTDLSVSYVNLPAGIKALQHIRSNEAIAASWSAVLLLSGCLDAAALAWFAAHHMPVVGLAEPPAGLRVSHVDIDNTCGGRIGMRHLLRCGCRRVLVLDDRRHRFGLDRVRGMHQALRQAGVKIDDSLFVDLDAAHSPQSQDSSAAITGDFLRRQAIDGVFVIREHPTIGVYRAISAAGLTVGRDIAVLHYNDYPWLSEVLQPQPSAIRQPFDLVAAEATRLLIRQLHEGPQHTVIRVKPQLIVRASSGASATNG